MVWLKYPPDPLLTQEQWCELAENGTDDQLWEAICAASSHDLLLHHVFQSVTRMDGRDGRIYECVPRHRILMIALYHMMLRNRKLEEQYKDLLDRQPPPMLTMKVLKARKKNEKGDEITVLEVTPDRSKIVAPAGDVRTDDRSGS